MSFILEALKKSDKKNREGTVPKLETIHHPVAGPESKRPKWIMLLLLVLALNVALLLWLFAPFHPEISPVIEAHSPALKTEIPEAKAVRDVETPRSDIAPSKASIPVRMAPGSPPAVKKSVSRNVPPETSETGSATVNPPTDQSERIYKLAELPPTIGNDIPDMHMSLHAFNRESNSASMVRINNTVLREGDKLEGKFLLKKITAEGAVFLIDGYRFLVPRKGYPD